MVEIKNIKATGDYVVLKLVTKVSNEELYKQSDSGILVPNQEKPEQSVAGKLELDYALVHDVGPDVKNPSFNVHDKVVFNEYDIKYVGSEDNMYGIVKSSSIMSVYET